jgi:nicotinate dehydrogenase subunit B
VTDDLVGLVVNGTARMVPPGVPLLSLFRDQLGLTGAKPGCGEGVCGACTVLLDGQPVRSCQETTLSVAGGAITTIEGLAADGDLHPVQRAFADEGAAQCGYCTPGFVLSAAALLEQDADPDDRAVDAALGGHICRCGGYPRIRLAVRRASQLTREKPAAGRGGPDGDRWGPPPPGERHYRPERPWDLSSPAERDWFGALGDGLVVVLEPAQAGAGGWTTARGAWLHLGTDGIVTAFTGKVDVGQDNRTALRLLVAEELGVPVGTVRIAMGDTDLCPHDLGTFGSRSMPDAGSALRCAAAFARGLPKARPGERRIEIVTGEPALSDPAGWQQAGRGYPAPGMVAAVTGARCFVADLNTPGILHGALLRPPVPGSALRSFDPGLLSDWPDVTLIRDGELTGVVAPDLATARRAIAALAGTARWDVQDAPSDADLSEYLRSHPAEAPQGRDQPFRQQDGSAATALEMAAVRCEATYEAAYIAAAAMETRAALAIWADDGRLTVWTGTQTPFPVRAQVAAALAVDEAKVRIIVPPTGGAFGGKHPATIAIEAATLARHAGRPVRVVWSRAEEFAVGGLRRAAVIDVTAGATADGKLSGWTFFNVNAGTPGIATPYRVADQRLEYQPARSPLIQGSYRGLAATANNFARESMIDELAARLRMDPVEFRLANLADERLAAVLRAVAERAGWSERCAAGWGIACGREKDGRVATAVRIAVGPDRRIRVLRLVSGYECGAIVNPRAVTAQVEGAAVMALGGALYERIEFTGGVITNAAFSGYRVPRIGDVPAIEVVLLDRPDLPSAGAGETPMIAVAPAIAAAVFDATGERLRSLPLTLPETLAETSGAARLP